MNRLLVLCIALLGTIPVVFCQGLSISNGTVFSLGGATLSLTNNWSNSGTFVAGTGTVVFNGPTGGQSITSVAGDTFNIMTVNKGAGDILLGSNIAIVGSLIVTSGDVDLNGFTVTLGPNALLSETAGNTVKGSSGSITTSRTLAASPGNVAGLGLELTSTDQALGITTITRGHAAQSGAGNFGILRFYTVSSTVNSSLNASISVGYDETELNSLTEATLDAYVSTDNGTTWTVLAGSLNTTSNTFATSGLNSLSRYTLASNTAPLPVQLTSLTASVVRWKTELKWATATEVDNFGFEVERRNVSSQSTVVSSQTEAKGWGKIAFVPGMGTSTSVKEYSFADNGLKAGRYAYRLKQIDRSGTFAYSYEVEVEVGLAPSEFALSQNYPNPFNPSTTISFSVPQDGHATLKVFDILGREVATLVNGIVQAGHAHEAVFDASHVASGMYYARLESGGKQLTKKMQLVK